MSSVEFTQIVVKVKAIINNTLLFSLKSLSINLPFLSKDVVMICFHVQLCATPQEELAHFKDRQPWQNGYCPPSEQALLVCRRASVPQIISRFKCLTSGRKEGANHMCISRHLIKAFAV